MAHPFEEAEKVLLRIGERLNLRGPQIDALHRQVLAEERRELLEGALSGLSEMTLTVVDGDFPREVVSRENLTWGAPRIQSEIAMLGYSVAERTVAKYMVRTGKPPSQTWRTFLENHVTDLAAIDFFTVPTATFRVLYCFVVLRHDRRQVVHFNVTAHPSAP